MILIILGPPGSGKGTQSKMLFEKYNLVHISTGEIFREILKADSPVAKELKKFVEQGLFVPDDIVMEVVGNRLDHEDCMKNGFLLDGFPRNLSQAKFLDKYLSQKDKEIDSVIYLEISDEIIISRLSSRYMCPSCSANYNLISNHPKSDKRCDSCGTELVQRKDDMADVVKRRLDIYKNETFPLLEYYIKKNLLVKINAENSVEEVFKDICNAIKAKHRHKNSRRN